MSVLVTNRFFSGAHGCPAPPVKLCKAAVNRWHSDPKGSFPLLKAAVDRP